MWSWDSQRTVIIMLSNIYRSCRIDMSQRISINRESEDTTGYRLNTYYLQSENKEISASKSQIQAIFLHWDIMTLTFLLGAGTESLQIYILIMIALNIVL